MPAGFFPKKAMILAAGLGTRMRSYNSELPKPMVEVSGKPLIDWSLDLVQQSGIQEVVVNTCYKAEIIETHLARRQHPRIVISREQGEPLETGGGIRNALPLLGDTPFFVLNSDVISLNGARPLLQRMAEFWDDTRMDGLLLLAPLSSASGYQGQGDFSLGGAGELRRRGENERAPYVFTGIQLLHPRIFENTPCGAFSMNLLYNRDMTPQGELPHFRGIAHDGQWLHIGDAQGVAEAEQRLQQQQNAPASAG